MHNWLVRYSAVLFILQPVISISWSELLGLECDVEADASASDKVIEINGGMRSIPVILFSDGTHLTEPSDAALKEKLESLKIL